MSRRRLGLPSEPSEPVGRYVPGGFSDHHREMSLAEFNVRQVAWIFVVWTDEGPRALARYPHGSRAWYLTADWFGKAFRYDDQNTARRSFKRVKLVQQHEKRAIVQIETTHALTTSVWDQVGFDIVERVGGLDE